MTKRLKKDDTSGNRTATQKKESKKQQLEEKDCVSNDSSNETSNLWDFSDPNKDKLIILKNGEVVKQTLFQGNKVSEKDCNMLKNLKDKLMKKEIPAKERNAIILTETRRLFHKLKKLKKLECDLCGNIGHIKTICPRMKLYNLINKYTNIKEIETIQITEPEQNRTIPNEGKEIVLKNGDLVETELFDGKYRVTTNQAQIFQLFREELLKQGKSQKEINAIIEIEIGKCVRKLNDTFNSLCSECDKVGHLKKSCPMKKQPEQQLYPKGKGCKLCGGNTHNPVNCPTLELVAEENK